MAPERCSHSSPHMNVIFNSKRDFSDIIEMSRWREYSGLSQWVQCNHRSPYKRYASQSERRKCDNPHKPPVGIKMVWPIWEGVFLKLNPHLPYDPDIPLQVTHPKESKYFHRNAYV